MVAPCGVSVREYTTEARPSSIKLVLLNGPKVLLQSAMQVLYIVICVHFLPCGYINRVNREQ